ncbi:hypothetical protein BLS_008675 [Venturia inaequalis]|uniref:Uncharacterized protein n=1 Tax=Venturia inaequalis TaxID=5025 RepID=A0A8H3ZAT0_VENIN|nr:hypothetical protein EG328_010969 [Venturia inaequalis]KAE9964057.1 hypothetical protein BLS_008675 [Venturia inaequalis]KAE9985586.1 hypothetical protein EG327_004630 [Venturia inaequalis]RDI82500.1 hypothetical protein Vi05172_g7562 [Venturia inaequalis]
MDMPPPVYKLKDDPEAQEPVTSETKAIANRRFDRIESNLAEERRCRNGCVLLFLAALIVTCAVWAMIGWHRLSLNQTVSYNQTALDNQTASYNQTAFYNQTVSDYGTAPIN